MINPKQFKQKKKRKVNPDIPRPNLFSHEKKLNEQLDAMERLVSIVDRQQAEIERLQNRLNTLESTVNIMGYAIKRR